MLNWLLPKYYLGTVYMELGGGPQIGEVTCGGSTQGLPTYHVNVITLK